MPCVPPWRRENFSIFAPVFGTAIPKQQWNRRKTTTEQRSKTAQNRLRTAVGPAGNGYKKRIIMASEKAKGIVLAAIAAATYGMNPLFALPLYAEGMDTYSVLFYRYLFAVPMLAVMIKAREGISGCKKRK